MGYIYFFIVVILLLLVLIETWHYWRKKHWLLGLGFPLELFIGSIYNIISKNFLYQHIYFYLLFVIIFILTMISQFTLLYIALYAEIISISNINTLFETFGYKKLSTFIIIISITLLAILPHSYFAVLYSLVSSSVTDSNINLSIWDSLYLAFGVYYSLPLPNQLQTIFIGIESSSLFRVIPIFHILVVKINEFLVLGLLVSKTLNAIIKRQSERKTNPKIKSRKKH